LLRRKAEYVFTFKARKRARENLNYVGVLRTHRFYIEYYDLLDGESPLKVVTDRSYEPKIAFPVKFVESIVGFAEDLGGRVVKKRRVKLAKSNSYYEKPVVVLPSEIAFRRHLLFSLAVSTCGSLERLNTLRNLVLSLNANFLNVLTTMALDRYFEFKRGSGLAWYWYMLRVGRALGVLYKLD